MTEKSDENISQKLSMEDKVVKKSRTIHFFSKTFRQRSCPADLIANTDTKKQDNSKNFEHCQVHHTQSFDYYVHPTKRDNLLQLSSTYGLNNNNDMKLPKVDDTLLKLTLSNEEILSGDEYDRCMEDQREAKKLQVYSSRKTICDEESTRMSVLNRLKSILNFWRSFLVIAVPLGCLPLLFIDQGEENENVFKCAYVMIIMASFWVTEALPLAITSLIPIALFPILGIMTTDDVGREYMKETNCMFISGIIVAIAVEHCNLHKRIALFVMLRVGTSPRSLMLGFMLPTMFLSMWISNTATTAMMVPIVDAVITELEQGENELRKEELNSDQLRAQANYRRKNRVMMFLSVAYAANTGGTGSLTGTGSNLVLKGILTDMSEDSPVNFLTWMAYAAPAMAINLFLCWVWLQIWFLGMKSSVQAAKNWLKFRKIRKIRSPKGNDDTNGRIEAILEEGYNALGPVSFHEGSTAVLFTLLVFLWLFRDPKFMTGWGNFVHVKKHSYVPTEPHCMHNCTYTRITQEKEAIDDATAGMIIAISLFIIPSTLNFWPFNRNSTRRKSGPSPGLLEWQVIHNRMPWGIVFLLGGGFALAKATDISGLSLWVGKQLHVLEGLDQRVLVLVICLCTAAATEVTSNVATCSILLPILRDLSFSLKLNPLYLMLPATLTCSYAFMLPVATPPNAIVYSASGMKVSDMVKCGFFFNLICVMVNFAFLNTFGIWMFNLNNFPEWAEQAIEKTIRDSDS